MQTPPRTKRVESLPAAIPFVGPEAIERRTGIPFTVRVGANESAFGISPKARDAMGKAINRISHYNDPENHDLRTALGAHHGITPDRISVGAGIDDLLGLAVRVYLGTGDVAVSSLGSYPTFHFHVAGFGADSHTVPYKQTGINDLEALAETAHKTRARLVYLANPDNPAGTWHSSKDLENFVNRLPETCACIIDEAYIEFAPEGTAYLIQDLDPRIMVMRTFSKAHGMAGVRVGYAIASPEVIKAFDKVRLHFNVNLVAQAGALASLHDLDFVHEVVSQVAAGRSEYELLASKLGMPTLASATNFVTFDAGSQQRAQAILENLAKKGVFIRKPGTPPLDRCFRVTVGTSKERKAFAEILPEVVKAVDSSQYREFPGLAD
ncbi:MAG: aminotransferase class I/II-fold pyridoxal phosphate-dependent enzyme [Verrucomicrobiae bacterium]|nr:aminotransferase class I/II-fold pyridoxal phosphate-dependent enzyme [Verrucomicrobiae bacterium]